MYIIGITGGIACGKSLVSNELKKYGARIISADKMAHWLMSPCNEIYNEYVKHFGEGILQENGWLNRKKIAKIIFNDKNELKWVNEMAHPILRRYVRERLIAYQRKKRSLIVLDVPLLFEAGWEIECDEVWVVILDRDKQIQRLMKRNHLNLADAESRIEAQLNDEERRKRADVIIDNNLDRENTCDQIRRQIEKKFPHLIKNYEEN